MYGWNSVVSSREQEATVQGSTVDRHAWASGGPEPVAPGVHRLPLPLPHDALRAVNTYVVDLPVGVALVDGGWAMPASMAELESGLGVLGREITDIRTVLVTHIHRDHYTQAVALRRLVGADIYLGSGERAGLQLLHRLATEVPESALAQLRQAGELVLERGLRARIGARDNYNAQLWENPDGWLDAGNVQLGERALQVIPTPGHTKGHVVFLDRSNHLMFTGDHVLPHITPSIGFELAERGLPLGDYLRSLAAVRSLADATMLPAHGGAGGSVHQRAEELITHHQVRLREAWSAVDRCGAVPAGIVAAQLKWTRSRRPFSDLDDFDKMLAVCETVAHLDLLVHRDELSESVVDNIRLYRTS